jgi:tetratricopeptide (TPR) repeat protein
MQGRALARRWGWLVCLSLFLFVVMASAGLVRAQAAATRGVALILSSGSGGGDDQEIATDAAAMARTLGRDGLGYEVIQARNPSREDLAGARADLLGRLEGAPIAVIYYAGYGVRVDGVDYIIPSGAKLTSAADVPAQAFSVDTLVSAARGKGAEVVLLLDACRPREALKAIGLQCLGGMVRGRDHIYALASGPSTGPGPDLALSPFTGQLVRQLQKGLPLRQVFAGVSEALPDAVVDLPFGGDPLLAPSPAGGLAPARTRPQGAAPAATPAAINFISSDELKRRFVELVGNVANANNLYDEGEVQEARNREPALLQEATTLQAVDPKFPGLHRELGRLALIRGDYAVAASEFEMERAARPNEGGSLYMGFLNLLLGTAYLREDRLDDAIQTLAAASFTEASGESYFKNAARRSVRLGEAYRLAGRKDEAIDALMKANALSPNIDNAAGHIQLAYLYLEAGQPDDAVGESMTALTYRRQTASHAGLAQAYAVLAQAKWAQGHENEAQAWSFVMIARQEDPADPEIAKAVAALPPFVSRPAFRNRPRLAAGFDLIEDQAMSCYADPAERNAYLDGIRRQTDAMQATLETLKNYMNTLGAQEAAYRARGYNDFHPNFSREFDWWTSRFNIIQNRSNQLGGIWFAYVVANAGDCKDLPPTRLAPPPGYDPRQYLLSNQGDPEAGAPPTDTAAAPAPARSQPPAVAAPPPPPAQPALPPTGPAASEPTVAKAEPPPPVPPVQAAPVQPAPAPRLAPPPPQPEAPEPAPPTAPKVTPPPPQQSAIPPPPAPARSAPPQPSPATAAKAAAAAPPVAEPPPPARPPAPAAPPKEAPASQPPAPAKAKTPAGPPPLTGYELARRKPPPQPAPTTPAPALIEAAPAPPPPPARVVIAPGILTARTLLDPLPTKPLKPAEQQAVRVGMDQARQAMAAGNFAAAEPLFGKVIGADPGNATGLLAEAYLGRGRARLGLHQEGPAKDDFDFVTDRRLGPYPVLAAAAVERGKLLQAHDALGPAADSYDLAVTADPKNAQAHYLRGMLLLRAGSLLSAREALEAALGVKLDYAEALAGLGDIDFIQNQYGAAGDHYAKALSYRPDLWRAAYGRARALYQAQQFGPALQAFQALIGAPRPPEIGATYDAGLYCGAGLSAVGKAWTSRNRDDWIMAGSGFDQADLAQAPPALVKRWKKLVDIHRKTDSNPLGRKLGDALATQGDKTHDYMSPPSLDPAQACAVYPGVVG